MGCLEGLPSSVGSGKQQKKWNLKHGFPKTAQGLGSPLVFLKGVGSEDSLVDGRRLVKSSVCPRRGRVARGQGARSARGVRAGRTVCGRRGWVVCGCGEVWLPTPSWFSNSFACLTTANEPKVPKPPRVRHDTLMGPGRFTCPRSNFTAPPHKAS